MFCPPKPSTRPWRWAVGLAAWLVWPSALAQDVTATEAALKARVVHNLVRFTQWPASGSESAPLRLCVATRDPVLLAAFAAQQGLPVGGYRIEVVPYSPAATDCRALFVHGQAARLPDPSAAGVLTVGDADGFAARGGMVELVLVNDALRFDVNLAALRGARVQLSSQVLRLARRVIE